ncbi:MAG TPA: phenylacetate--CoA ligase, partial [Candidatus Melainabacteria bacterium]|nr:phenylacetate--CoA ligase [Candidatus Melainabacteria bacterium]
MVTTKTDSFIWNEKAECQSRKDLEKLQLKRLKTMLASVYEKVPFYRRRFDQAGIKPDGIDSLKALSSLPFTKKTDLRENYPFGL